MPKMLPPVCFCEYCGEKYFEFPKDSYRKLNQFPGRKAQSEHYAVCPKAPITIAKRSGTMKTNESNCPVCGLIMRANNIIRHCANKHAYVLSCCMPNKEKEQSKKHRCPIVIAFKDGGHTDVLKVCLVCKKGYTDGSVHKEMFADMRFDHKQCCKEFDKYAELFEPSETLMDLPFDIHATATKRKIRHVGSDAPEISFRETAVAVGGAGTADSAELEKLRTDYARQQKAIWRAMNPTEDEEDYEEPNIIDVEEWCKEHEEMIQTTLKDAKKPLYRKIADLEKKVADYESGREVARLKDRVRELEADRRGMAVFEDTMIKLGYKGKRIDSDSD